MTLDVLCCRKDSTIGDVLMKMEGHNFKNVPVLDDAGEIVGVVSYYGVQDEYQDDGVIDEAVEFVDTTRNLLTGGRWSALKNISVNPAKVGPDADITEIAQKMVRGRTDCVIVVGEDDKPVGIVTEVDIAKRVIAKGALLSTSVEKVMTKRLVILENTETITSAFEKMLKARVHHLPLVNKAGKLAGSILYRDIARAVHSRLYLGETMVSDQIPSSDD
jgi:CBS domain-containing protein